MDFHGARTDVQIERDRFVGLADDDLREHLPTWSPIPLQALPFPSVLVASRNDPYCSYERARLFAHAWGSQFMDYGSSGHINAESGLASWPEGHVLLQDLMKD